MHAFHRPHDRGRSGGPGCVEATGPRPAEGEVPAGSLQKRLEYSPGRLRWPCRLKRANVRHSGRGGLRSRWGSGGASAQHWEACPTGPCPDLQAPPGLEDRRLRLCLQGHDSQREGTPGAAQPWTWAPGLPGHTQGPPAPRPPPNTPGPCPARRDWGHSSLTRRSWWSSEATRAWKGADPGLGSRSPTSHVAQPDPAVRHPSWPETVGPLGGDPGSPVLFLTPALSRPS